MPNHAGYLVLVCNGGQADSRLAIFFFLTSKNTDSKNTVTADEWMTMGIAVYNAWLPYCGEHSKVVSRPWPLQLINPGHDRTFSNPYPCPPRLCYGRHDLQNPPDDLNGTARWESTMGPLPVSISRSRETKPFSACNAGGKEDCTVRSASGTKTPGSPKLQWRRRTARLHACVDRKMVSERSFPRSFEPWARQSVLRPPSTTVRCAFDTWQLFSVGYSMNAWRGPFPSFSLVMLGIAWLY